MLIFSANERRVGYIDIKTGSRVYFQVQRNAGYGSTKTVIRPYQVEKLNVGGAMNLATGTFTTPTNGIYSFSLTALSGAVKGASVHLRLNGVQIAVSDTHISLNSISLSSIVKLKKGDKVDVWLDWGAIYDSHYSFTTFNGMLVEEDLVL